MTTEPPVERRLKFYGLKDYGTYFQVERAASILERYDPSAVPPTVADALELHNAQRFAENNLFPKSYTEEQQSAGRALISKLRATVAKFFNAIDDDNVAAVVLDVSYELHTDLLELFSQYKVYDRCAVANILPVLDSNGVGLGEMLASRGIVRAYDQELRAKLLADATNAEFILRKYLVEQDTGREIYLPASLSSADSRTLINEYLDSVEANPNFVQLISRARVHSDSGIDAKTKLKAQRMHERWLEDFFKQNKGIETGCEVVIADEQAEPVEVSMNGLVVKLSYSRQWLSDGLDYPTILNNFIYIFEFVDAHMLLRFPAYQAQRGVFERITGVAGKKDYPVGAAFRFTEQTSFLCLVAYDSFLKSQDIELESIIAWVFMHYLKDEFGADNFRFTPSSRTSTYLEKCRHLFAEMESIAKQFQLYVENGELDTGLLGVVSDQVQYKVISSQMTGKYASLADDQDIRDILHLLFSDQSSLGYVSEALKGDDAATLLTGNRLSYDDFADYQRPSIDYLIRCGVLENAAKHIRFTSNEQLLVLRHLFASEAVSYYRYPPAVRAAIDQMVTRGWLVREATLLTEAEAGYFNYCLNQAEYSNGPDLRNKYLHGSHVDASDEDEHFRTYITALKLLIALVIKMNDDFWLYDVERTG